MEMGMVMGRMATEMVTSTEMVTAMVMVTAMEMVTAMAMVTGMEMVTAMEMVLELKDRKVQWGQRVHKVQRAHKERTNGISPEVMAAADTNILNQAQTYVNQVGQQTLNQANAYTDSRVNALNRDMRKLEDRTYAAVASSIAIASLPQPTDAGYNMFSAGVGTWEGEQGYAFGLSGVTESNKYVYKVAVTTNSEGDFGAGAAIGWQWK